ncbi:MAG TPA: biotin--[acetyl-CoA-carboxylase] ligase [Bacteriovoracaceae bacterium]|nr:biotin--[acetyl-CoA-carboxylase] ligase [Bacteriovoracaceae bacterium]
MIKHIHVKECDSTQDLLKEQLGLFKDANEILVSCDNQLKGRGRGIHNWEALPGSLCFSLTVQPHPIPSFTAIEMSLLVARFFEGSVLTLKWPNDIWNRHENKCCGILVQNHHGIMIAGIGLNLYSEHHEFGGIYDTHFEFNKNSWSFEIANFIQANRYKTDTSLKRDWEARCGHMGSLVCIEESGQFTEGIFEGLGEHGQAMLKTPHGIRHMYNGSLRVLSSGH